VKYTTTTPFRNENALNYMHKAIRFKSQPEYGNFDMNFTDSLSPEANISIIINSTVLSLMGKALEGSSYHLCTAMGIYAFPRMSGILR
jgi:hypothetical protein